MSFALARSLLLADAVTAEALAQALLVSATRGTSLVRALLTTRAIDALRLEQQLERGEAPYMRHVAPVMSLVQQLPPGLCDRLLALPVRRDPRTGTVDVAVVDARDPHPVQEVAHWLHAPVRMVRTSLAAMDAALRRLDAKPEPPGVRPLAAPIWVPTPGPAPVDLSKTPAYGSPVVDESKLAALDEDIPIPLKRRTIPPDTIVEVGPPAIEKEPRSSDGEPVLELRRRKSSNPPDHRSLLPAESPLERIRGAADRDRILELVVEGVQPIAPRVAVFAVRKDSLVGWTCSPEMADRAELRAARFTPGPETALDGVLAAEGATFVRIPKDATHAPLLAGLKRAPAGDVAIAPIRVDAKPVALVMADGYGDALAIAKHLEDIAQAASEALARLLRDRRK